MDEGVRWQVRPGEPAAAHVLARELVAQELSITPASVLLTHACPRCASEEHGPLVALDAETRKPLPIHLSISRTASNARSWVAAAVSTPSPVGIDVEYGEESVALPHWVRAEAVLKALGVGLQIDPDQLTFAGDPVRLIAAPSPIDPDQIAVRDLIAERDPRIHAALATVNGILPQVASPANE